MSYVNLNNPANFQLQEFEQLGFRYIVSGRPTIGGETYRTIFVLTDAVVTATCPNGDSLSSETLVAGTVIHGFFEDVSVASGSLLAYKAGPITAQEIFDAYKAYVYAQGGIVEGESCAVADIAALLEDKLYSAASLVLIPSGYKVSHLYAERPLDSNGDFTFTRASSATRVGPDGNIEKETQNLLLQSNSFNTTWGTYDTSVTGGQSGYDGSSDAWLLDITAATGFQTLRQTISNSGAQTFSIYAKAGTLDWMRLTYAGGTGPTTYFDISNGVLGSVGGVFADIEDVGNGWYRCSTSFSGSFTELRIYPATANNNPNQSSGNILIQDAQLNYGLVAQEYQETTTTSVVTGITNDMPRLDYSGGASCPSLLLEPQRTNLVMSEYYGNLIPTRVTLTSNYGISPEGVQNAAAIFNTTENGLHNLNGSYFAVTSGTSYVNSVFAKAGTITKMGLRMFSGGGIDIGFNDGDFDLTNGTATGTGAGIESYGNGWYRCYVVDSPTSSVSNARFNVELLDANGSSIFDWANRRNFVCRSRNIRERRRLSHYIERQYNQQPRVY
jgi:hypothetical protein